MQEAVARVVDGQLDTILVRGTELEETFWTQIEPVLPSGAADLLRPSHPFLDDWDTVNEPIVITEPEPNYLDTEVEAPIVVGRAAMPTAESRSSAALVQLRSAVIELQVREHACHSIAIEEVENHNIAHIICRTAESSVIHSRSRATSVLVASSSELNLLDSAAAVTRCI